MQQLHKSKLPKNYTLPWSTHDIVIWWELVSSVPLLQSLDFLLFAKVFEHL